MAPGPTVTRSASRNRRSSTRPSSPSRAARPTWFWWSGARPGPGHARAARSSTPSPRPPDATVTRPPDFVAPIEIAAGIVWPPVQQYALIENALAHHEQQGAVGTPPGRGAHSGPASTRWPRHNPLAAFPDPALGRRHRHPGSQEPPAGVSLQQVARQPVDRRPGGRAPVLLGGAGAGSRRVAGPVDLSPRGPARVRGGHVDGAAGHARLARHGGAGTGRGRPPGPALGRGGDRRGVFMLSGRRPGAAAGAWASIPTGPRRSPAGCRSPGGPSTTSCSTRRPPWPRSCGPSRTELGLVTTVSGMLSKPGLAVWSASPPGPPSLMADLAGSPAVDTPAPAGGAARQPRWPRHGGLVHRDLRRRRSPPAGPDGDRGRPARRDPDGCHLR